MIDQEEKFFDQFIRRVSYGKTILKLDSNGLHAGSPHYVYCEHCSTPTEAFPEKPLFPTKQVCSQCTELENKNILQKAKEISQKFFSSKS